MTSRTACQNIRSLYVIFLLPLLSERDLFFRTIALTPFHIKNLVLWPDEFLRRAMALQTPFHLQRIRLRNYRHLIDAAMTSRTTNTLRDVNRVIEISEVRQVVHAYPFERFARLETRAYRFEIRTVSPNLFMTIHADLRRRYPGGGRSLDRCVTVTTIDAVIADVVFVTELDRLLAFDVLPGVPAGTSDLGGDPQRGNQNEDRAVNRGSR